MVQPLDRRSWAVLVFIALCSGSGTIGAAIPVMTARVNIDLYSGRPNPSWDLSSDETIRLLSLVEALTPTGTAPPSDGLGYRGVTVTVQTTPVQTFAVANGFVQVKEEGKALRFLHDPQRSVERWLLETGRGRLEADLLDSLLGQLSSK
jgi:hypothetical protein